jgi:DNA polymerase III subunit delta'
MTWSSCGRKAEIEPCAGKQNTPPVQGEVFWENSKLRGSVRSALHEESALADAFAEVVQLGAANLAFVGHFDLGDPWGVNREDALDAFAVRDLADGESGVHAGSAFCEDDACENLDPLFAAFDDPAMDLHGVTDIERGDVLFQLLLLDLFDDVHGVLFRGKWVGLRGSGGCAGCAGRESYRLCWKIATPKSRKTGGFFSMFSINGFRIESAVGAIEGQFRAAVVAEANDIAVKTRAAAGVTSSCADLFDVNNQGVLIAIRANFDDFLDMAGGFSFVPKFLTGTRPIDGFADFQSAAQRFLIHVSEHQRLFGDRIDRHRRNQSVGVEFWGKFRSFLNFRFSAAWGESVVAAHGRMVTGDRSLVNRKKPVLELSARRGENVRAMAYTAERAFELISSAQKRGRLAHAFLISGAAGSGKENLAARVIQLVSGNSGSGGVDLFGQPVVEETPSLDELESGWVRIIRPKMKSRRVGVDEIRNLEHTLHLAAPHGACKVGVIVEADRMNDQAANAFLKTLEEPPQNTLLLLLTANPQRLLPTILSRCIGLSLLGGRSLLEDGGEELVAALNRAATRGFGTPVGALHLKAAFSSFLADRRSDADAAAKAAEKEEVSAYRDATDGAWLKEREAFHKAAAEAEYLESRSRLFDVLMAWMADLLRLKMKAGGLDFPETAPELREVVERESEIRLLQRVEALESLRRTLETNAFEPLAIEVGFLKAFG